MKIGILPSSPLFCGMTTIEIEDMLSFLSASAQLYADGEYIFKAGDKTETAGLVLLGGVNIIKIDAWGNRKIIEQLRQGQIFAETYACNPTEPLLVNVESNGASKILFLNMTKVFTQEASKHSFTSKFIHNLVFVLAKRNLLLTRKMDYITPKSIRSRIISYLTNEALTQNKNEFDIIFNRQQLADYLSVDRSALSNELSKMQKDGLLTMHKRHFVLLVDPSTLSAEQ